MVKKMFTEFNNIYKRFHFKKKIIFNILKLFFFFPQLFNYLPKKMIIIYIVHLKWMYDYITNYFNS